MPVRSRRQLYNLAVGHFLSPVLPSGIRFRTSSEIKAVQKALSNSRWRHIFLRSISMDSALDMRMTTRYTNLRFIIIIIIINRLMHRMIRQLTSYCPWVQRGVARWSREHYAAACRQTACLTADQSAQYCPCWQHHEDQYRRTSPRTYDRTKQ